MMALYYQTKTLISFWYRRELNSRSLIQLSKILSIELRKTKTMDLVGIIFMVEIFSFEIEFQPMTSAPDESSLLSDQNTNQFLV